MSLLRINIVGQVTLSLYGTIRQVGSAARQMSVRKICLQSLVRDGYRILGVEQ